jgi:hypothetical protein
VVMFSKKESKCSVCSAKVLMNDIITQNWDNQWVHISCAITSVQPNNIFAMCLRCTHEIESELDAVPSSVGTTDGYVHVRCSNQNKKRSRAAMSDGDTDGDIVSSQGSV